MGLSELKYKAVPSGEKSGSYSEYFPENEAIVGSDQPFFLVQLHVNQGAFSIEFTGVEKFRAIRGEGAIVL